MKKIIVTIAVACLLAVSVSAFAMPKIQTDASKKILDEKNASGTDTKHVFNSDVTENNDKVDDSSQIQSGQSVDKNEPTVGLGETSQNQVSNLPLPLPDGRIFLQTGAGAEDPIAYIPTQNPKTGNAIPITPPELDV